MSGPQASEPGYAITVRGVAGPVVQAAFSDLEVTIVGDTTVLGSQMADQAALHGILQRVQDLGLQVIAVRQLPEPAS